MGRAGRAPVTCRSVCRVRVSELRSPKEARTTGVRERSARGPVGEDQVGLSSMPVCGEEAPTERIGRGSERPLPRWR